MQHQLSNEQVVDFPSLYAYHIFFVVARRGRNFKILEHAFIYYWMFMIFYVGAQIGIY